MNRIMLRLATALAIAATAASAPTIARDDDVDEGGSISRVNKSISVDDGAKLGDLDTVNGSIRIGENASVRTAETVNGSVRLGRGSHADAVETVNGAVTLSENVTVARDVETVNGSIELERGAEVVGGLANVNGAIDVRAAHVGGRIETVAGDIRILDGARIDGGLLVEEPSGGNFNWKQNRPPRIVIGENAVVGGELRFDREVELHVHSTAKIGKVVGAEPKRYTGNAPF